MRAAWGKSSSLSTQRQESRYVSVWLTLSAALIITGGCQDRTSTEPGPTPECCRPRESRPFEGDSDGSRGSHCKLTQPPIYLWHAGCRTDQLPLVHAVRVRQRRPDAGLHHFTRSPQGEASTQIRSSDCQCPRLLPPKQYRAQRLKDREYFDQQNWRHQDHRLWIEQSLLAKEPTENVLR